ncbi:MAG: flagellar export protein FliJ [Ruminococcus sp.]|nr:flagellar export protein FliJ [Ruminococcus sp.]MBO5383612.1 flagellar export protein FliJ [Ruminococcus sp.]
MKKFEFSLGRIRDYKNSILDKEKSVLAGLRMEQNNIEARIKELDNYEAELNAEMREKIRVGLSVGEIKMYEFKKNNIRDEKIALNHRLEFLAASIELQQKRMEKLKQETSSYDKLEEKQRAEYNAELLKEQEQVISEFISQKLIREKTN